MMFKALKQFQSDYGMIRMGQTFACEDHLAKSYLKNGLIAAIEDLPENRRTQAHAAAPQIKKNESPSPRLSRDDSALMPESGAAQPLPSSRAARRSRKRT